ncbi:hypothetical protein C8R44DRAFT_891108 [Mycena epipterygia]|nr:hypothetical protein C8R44DRAFT_891108 [Mycena epipterygia]
MASLLTLPSELVVHIFATLIADVGDDGHSEPVVLRLCSVCKFLRDLVVNSPTLWTSIRLRTFTDLNSAHLFIDRSKTCLLDLFVSFNVLNHIPQEVIKDLNVPRWRRLSVRGPYSSEITRFVQAITDIPTPELRDVQLLAGEQSNCANEHIPILSGAADALRTLTMRGCIRCLAPLPQLTRLNISRLLCNYAEFRDLIQGSPNLTTLILVELLDHLDPQPVTAPRPLIEAPSLRSLAVEFVNFSDDRSVLAFLSLPNLEYLEVASLRADCGEFSGQPLPALRTLCLRDMSFPTANAALYRSFSKITHLELNNVDGVGLLAAPDEEGAVPWPALRSIVCRFPDEQNCSWLEQVLNNRPRLSLQVPEHWQNKDSVLALAPIHDVRFLSSEEPSGLIRKDDFAPADWEDEGDSYSDGFSGSEFDHYSDEADFFEEHYDSMLEEVDDYLENDDDDFEDEGWSP